MLRAVTISENTGVNKISLHFLGLVAISLASLFNCFKEPQTYWLRIYVYFCRPRFGSWMIIMKVNSSDTTLAPRPPVCGILPISRFSEINKSVIRSILINVVNLFLWPLSGHAKPRKAVFIKFFSKHTNGTVSIDHAVASSVPSNSPGATVLFPSKKPSVWVVINKFKNFIFGEHQCRLASQMLFVKQEANHGNKS